MKRLLFALLVFQASTMWAKSADVIDLGSLEVQGQVRQPPIQFYQPKVVPSAVLLNVAESTFMFYETETSKKNSKISKSPYDAKKIFVKFEAELLNRGKLLAPTKGDVK